MKPFCLAEKLVGRIGDYIKSGNIGKIIFKKRTFGETLEEEL